MERLPNAAGNEFGHLLLDKRTTCRIQNMPLGRRVCTRFTSVQYTVVRCTPPPSDSYLLARLDGSGRILEP